VNVILLFGVPRCGSTWASEVLAAGTAAKLLHEPCNADFDAPDRRWSMHYLPADGDDPQLLAHLRWHMFGGGRLKALLQRNRTFLIKEVVACLLAPYLHTQFNAHTIIQLRHPCAVAASWRSMGFRTEGLSKMLGQPLFVERFAKPYAKHAQGRDDYLFQVGAIWGLMYQALSDMREQFPQWQFVTHEQLCTDPQAEFDALLHKFGMKMLPAGRAYIAEHNRARDEKERRGVTFRDARSEIDKWKKDMNDQDAALVFEAVRAFPVFEQFYPD
jgi:hypothetical protein